MEKRTDSPLNEGRAKELGKKVFEAYILKPEAIHEIDDTQGQVNLAVQDIFITLNAEDFQRMGFRMGVKNRMTINDLTVLAEIASGQRIFEATDLAEDRDFHFMRLVIKEIRDQFRNFARMEKRDTPMESPAG